MKNTNKIAAVLLSLMLSFPATAFAQELPAEPEMPPADTEITEDIQEEPAGVDTETEDSSGQEDTTEESENPVEDTDGGTSENTDEDVETTEEPEETEGEPNEEELPESVFFHIYYNGCDLVDAADYAAGDVVMLPDIDDELFTGWATAEGAETAEYLAGDTLTFADVDIILFAVFEKQEELETPAKEEKAQKFRMSYDNSMAFRGSSDISIDGNFGDWDGLPYSYEYNWDNSQNCWYWGVWIPTPEGNICYKTPEGEYSTDVRHKMQLYCDGQNVYLHVIISRDYGSRFNGEDYQFYIDGQMAAFQIEWPGGGTITGNLEEMTSPGTYSVEVKHRNSSMSYEEAAGSAGYLKVCDDYVNNELEISIPLSKLVRQNEAINTDTMSTIEFFTPNLMYRRITCAGTPTFLELSTIICFVIAASGVVLFAAGGSIAKKKRIKGTENDV